MARILRGDIVWADLNPTRGYEQGGARPVVVLSDDVFNARSGTVIPGVGTLEALQPPGAVGAPFPLSGAKINDRGQIIFSGTLTDGRSAMFLVTPHGNGGDQGESGNHEDAIPPSGVHHDSSSTKHDADVLGSSDRSLF